MSAPSSTASKTDHSLTTGTPSKRRNTLTPGGPIGDTNPSKICTTLGLDAWRNSAVRDPRANTSSR